MAHRIIETTPLDALGPGVPTQDVESTALKKGDTVLVKAGETINVKKPPITYSFKVLQCIEQRVGAKLIPQVYENVTDPKQYEILEMSRISGFVDRARGTGRPTKKDRRSLDAFIEPAMFGFDDDFDDDFD